MYRQGDSPAPYGYDYFVSLSPRYDNGSSETKWPLIVFLHGAGESQRGKNESHCSIRHGIPKMVLAHDAVLSGAEPKISIPPHSEVVARGWRGDNSTKPVDPETAKLVAEEFITVTPSLDMTYGYGWKRSILSALLEEVRATHQVDDSRIYLRGFSMGAHGTWELAIDSPPGTLLRSSLYAAAATISERS